MNDRKLPELRVVNGSAETKKEVNPAKLKKPDRFQVIDLADVEIDQEPAWLVDRLLTSTGLATVYGLPKSGKTFIVADAVFHIAMAAIGLGSEWAQRAVMGGAVAYVSGEGVTGLKRRLVALRRHYKVEGKPVPFGFIPVAPDLGHENGEAPEVIAHIKAWQEAKGYPPVRIVVVDTLSRSMQGADESMARDMSMFVTNCERITQELGCLVIAIHHAGKDAARGTRGSNSLEGASDVIWYVEKDEASTLHTVTIQAMKDAEEGETWSFSLQPFELEVRNKLSVLREGSATNSCIVNFTTYPGKAQHPATNSSRQKISDNATLLVTLIRNAIADAGTYLKGNPLVPHNQLSMSRVNLKRYLKPGGYWDDDLADNVNRVHFSRDLKTLKQRGYIGLTSDYVWLL